MRKVHKTYFDRSIDREEQGGRTDGRTVCFAAALANFTQRPSLEKLSQPKRTKTKTPKEWSQTARERASELCVLCGALIVQAAAAAAAPFFSYETLVPGDQFEVFILTLVCLQSWKNSFATKQSGGTYVRTRYLQQLWTAKKK